MRVLHVTQGCFPAMGGTELLIQRVSAKNSATSMRWSPDGAVAIAADLIVGAGWNLNHLGVLEALVSNRR